MYFIINLYNVYYFIVYNRAVTALLRLIFTMFIFICTLSINKVLDDVDADFK